jgi:hypothetical protein
LTIVNDKKHLSKIKSTRHFWQEFGKEVPNLVDLASILNNILPSSSFIERFFSICSYVSNKRNSKMTDDLFSKRCLLKANFHILDELAFISREDE